MNTYADACKSLREAIEDYIDAAAWELHGKMPALDAVDLAKVTAHKAVDVIAGEALQRHADHVTIPDSLAEIFEQNGGALWRYSGFGRRGIFAPGSSTYQRMKSRRTEDRSGSARSPKAAHSSASTRMVCRGVCVLGMFSPRVMTIPSVPPWECVMT